MYGWYKLAKVKWTTYLVTSTKRFFKSGSINQYYYCFFKCIKISWLVTNKSYVPTSIKSVIYWIEEWCVQAMKSVLK